MKLKKIISLAAAALMAVSMLTACGEGNSNSTVTPPVEDNTPATGYSSQLGEELVDKNTNTRKLAMSDSTALNSALQSALKYAADRDIAWRYDANLNATVSFVTPVATTTNATRLVADRLVDIVGGETTNNATSATTIAQLNPNNNTADAEEDMSVALLYVVDGGVSIDAAIERIAEDINDDVAAMVNAYNMSGTSGETHEVSYKYTGSVSADTITVDADHGKSMTFIAVQINRTVV